MDAYRATATAQRTATAVSDLRRGARGGTIPLQLNGSSLLSFKRGVAPVLGAIPKQQRSGTIRCKPRSFALCPSLMVRGAITGETGAVCISIGDDMSNSIQPRLFDLPSNRMSALDQIKDIDTRGLEYWSGRKLLHLIGYSNWTKLDAVFQDLYSIFCLTDPLQTHISPSFALVKIGYGVKREVPDWKLSRLALDKVLARAALINRQ